MEYIVVIVFMSFMGYHMYKSAQLDREYTKRCEEDEKRRQQETEELLQSLKESFAKSDAKQKEQYRIKQEQEEAKMQYYRDITEIKETLRSTINNCKNIKNYKEDRNLQL